MQLNYRGRKYETNSPVVGLRNSNPADATLSYRGVSYDTNLPVQISTNAPLEAVVLTETGAAPVTQLNYRGIQYEANSPVVNLCNSNPADATLKYRGISYTTNLPVDAATEAPIEAVSVPVAAVFTDRARVLMMNHHRQVKQRQQVMLTRLANSIGLDTNQSNQYWNHIQGKVHPSFWATYDRSHVASS